MNFDWYAHPWPPEEKKGFDCYAQIKLLEKDIDKENAKETHKQIVYGKRKVGKNEKPIDPIYPKLIEEMLVLLGGLLLRKPTLDISDLPHFTFFLQFSFTLAEPYLSKDDEAFYICENPIRKDKVFKVPMVSGSTWKGNMRWTARQTENLNPDKPDNDVIKRLFGNEKDEEKNFHRGRLNFYPAFFDQISLEVINPHDRKTKAGTLPIYIESVPEGATGTFSLLYVPFDLMGKPLEQIKEQVSEDIKLELAHKR
ncbi:MAG: hypothetical protein B6D35_13205, partial [Candidatus Brocadia sp. UTAMX2]